MDIVEKIIAYESGEMDEQEAIQFFQEILDSGMVWQLQGSYQRTARHLIEKKLINVA